MTPQQSDESAERAEPPAAAHGQTEASDAPSHPSAVLSHPSAVPPGTELTVRIRRVTVFRLAIAIAAALTLLGGPAAVAVDRTLLQAPDRARLSINAPAPARPVPDEPKAGSRSPRPGDPGDIRLAWVRDRIQVALDSQAAALLRGDEAGFLAPADPADEDLLGELRRRFAVLRAMTVTGWIAHLTGELTESTDGLRATVRLGYCFGVPGCSPVYVPVPTRWSQAGDRLQLVEFGTSAAADLGPRPWEVSDLRVAVGPRVIVATTARNAGRLAGTLAAAEQAAAVADRYAHWAPRPGRYLVFLAGPDEWTRWYGVRQANWVAAYAMPLTDRDTEIVLNAQRVTGGEVVDTLRHEFAHVVTLAAVRRDYSHQWWLVEGIAEYLRMVGRPLGEYDLMSAARRYVRDKRVTELSALAEPATGASTEDASGRYGLAFLTVRRLAERFGEDRMLRFFESVVREGTAPPDAARSIFEAEWDDITADCGRYVRKVLG